MTTNKDVKSKYLFNASLEDTILKHHSEGYLKLRKFNTGILWLKPQTLNTEEKLHWKGNIFKLKLLQPA
jgi:hypothetical protein